MNPGVEDTMFLLAGIPVIFMIDILGRRLLLMWGGAVMSVCALVMFGVEISLSLAGNDCGSALEVFFVIAFLLMVLVGVGSCVCIFVSIKRLVQRADFGLSPRNLPLTSLLVRAGNNMRGHVGACRLGDDARAIWHHSPRRRGAYLHRGDGVFVSLKVLFNGYCILGILRYY